MKLNLCGNLHWSNTLNQMEMIKDLQKRFGLSLVQAEVIYFSLENHFRKNNNSVDKATPDKMEIK